MVAWSEALPWLPAVTAILAIASMWGGNRSTMKHVEAVITRAETFMATTETALALLKREDAAINEKLERLDRERELAHRKIATLRERLDRANIPLAPGESVG